VNRYFVMRALQLPPEAWLRLAVSNASVTVLHIYPSGRVSLYSLGDVGHLPPSLITYN
jgi:serine/threonine-protein phosphatase PGAM5